jgi:hypothetical protein
VGGVRQVFAKCVEFIAGHAGTLEGWAGCANAVKSRS